MKRIFQFYSGLLCAGLLLLTLPTGALAASPAASVQIGDKTTEYTSCASAWSALVSAASTGSGAKMTLLSDWKAGSGKFGSGTGFTSGGALSVSGGKGMTLDLNGHKLDRGLTSDKDGGCLIAISGGTLSIIDSRPDAPTASDAKGGLLCGGYNDDEGGCIVLTSSGNLSMKGGTFYHCKSDDVGGALYMDHANNYVTLENVTFVGCWADDEGGAVFENDGTLNMTNVTFIQNESEETGGAVHMDEGHMNCRNCTFTKNLSDGDGGGVYIDTDSVTTFTDCTFSGNASSDSGGGLYVNSSDKTVLQDCRFTSNRCSDKGGGLCINGDRVFLVGGFYQNNTASSYGGGVYVDSLYDVSVAGKLVIAGNGGKNHTDNLCLQHGMFSTAYVYGGGLEPGSKISLSATDTDSEMALVNIDRYQYTSYFTFDTGFKADKVVAVSSDGQLVRAQASALGIGRKKLILLLSAVGVLLLGGGVALILILRRKGRRNHANHLA